MSFFVTAIIFVLFRLADFLISFLSPHFIPYLGFFPYKEIIERYDLPQFIYSFANFDGAHYLLIAEDGYTTYQQAFFPLYPILIKLLTPIFSKNYLLSGLFISNISFLIGLFLFIKYLKLLFKNNQRFSYLTVLFLLLFPTSFFFGAVYTEGLFFLFLASTLFFLKKERIYLAAISALLASLTKLVGIFLIIFFVLKLIRNWLHPEVQSEGKLKIRNFSLVLATLSPLLGLGVYSLYLWKAYEDPLFFLNSQWAFGANRSSEIILLPQVYFRYLKIFFTAAWNFQYFISLFEFITFTFVFVILILDLIKNWLHPEVQPEGKLEIRNYEKIGLNIFSFVNLLLPTLTGTFSSVPRYALFSLSFFLFLAQIKNIKIKIGIALIFAVFHIIMLSFFVQGYFVS